MPASSFGMPKKPFPPVRWTINHAAAEFGIDRATLSNRLRAAGIAAGTDGRFSSKQIAAAVLGDRGAELTAKTRAERENWELRNEEIRRTRIPIDMVESFTKRLCDNIAGILKSRRDKFLDEETMSDLFAELRGVGERLKNWKGGADE